MESASITYEDNVEIGGRIYLSRKGNVQITVDKTGWSYYQQALNPSGTTSDSGWCSYRRPNIPYGNGVFSIMSSNGYTVYSSNGSEWYRGDYTTSGTWIGTVWTGENFVALHGNAYVAFSPNGKDWTYTTPSSA